MPQLRWTLLFLGVVFVILLAWIERRRQRQRFTEHAPAAEREHALDPLGGSGSAAYREASLTLPEMRAREFSPPQDLPIVEIEEDSLNARRVEVGQPLLDPPTLSLPVLDSGPVKNRDRTEPTMSATDWIKTSDSDDVPRLDIPAPKRTLSKIELAVAEHTLDETAEREFNDAVFGDAGLGPGNDTVSHSEIEAAAAEAEAYANQRQAHQQVQADQPQTPASPVAASRSGAASAALETPAPETFGGSSFADVGDTVERPRPPPFIPADVTPVVEPIVEWPPDDQRRVVALRLVAPPPDRLAGRALRLALASEGFVLGKFQIFHKPDDNGRAVLSAANLSKPGTFDLATMDVQRFGGLSLFVVLPGPKPPLKAFDELLSTARNLNERLQGALQDERGGPLTPTRIATLRESLGADAAS
jgi:FtsZ-interacting cell division protein ZipA